MYTCYASIILYNILLYAMTGHSIDIMANQVCTYHEQIKTQYTFQANRCYKQITNRLLTDVANRLQTVSNCMLATIIRFGLYDISKFIYIPV